MDNMGQVSPGPYLITTSPSLIKCGKCGRPVLAATVQGLDRHIDTACLTQLGELAVLLEGRTTFNLRHDVLSVRGPDKIRAGTRGAPVLAQHACKDTPEEHIDPAWSLAAMALIIEAVGGVIVGEKIAHVPPF